MGTKIRGVWPHSSVANCYQLRLVPRLGNHMMCNPLLKFLISILSISKISRECENPHCLDPAPPCILTLKLFHYQHNLSLLTLVEDCVVAESKPWSLCRPVVHPEMYQWHYRQAEHNNLDRSAFEYMSRTSVCIEVSKCLSHLGRRRYGTSHPLIQLYPSDVKARQ